MADLEQRLTRCLLVFQNVCAYWVPAVYAYVSQGLFMEAVSVAAYAAAVVLFLWRLLNSCPELRAMSTKNNTNVARARSLYPSSGTSYAADQSTGTRCQHNRRR